MEEYRAQGVILALLNEVEEIDDHAKIQQLNYIFDKLYDVGLTDDWQAGPGYPYSNRLWYMFLFLKNVKNIKREFTGDTDGETGLEKTAIYSVSEKGKEFLKILAERDPEFDRIYRSIKEFYEVIKRNGYLRGNEMEMLARSVYFHLSPNSWEKQQFCRYYECNVDILGKKLNEVKNQI